MMAGKSVTLSNGTSFDQIGIAQEYFRGILRAKPVGIDLDEVEFEMVNTLYRDYCLATSWPIPHEIHSFTRGVETRVSSGVAVKTECFIVRFVDGPERSFSFLTACSKIAGLGR
jgi:hypothetical protein